MHITLASIGKTQSQPVAELEAEYAKRIRGRFSFTMQYVKNEKDLVRIATEHKGAVVLMDEHGSVMTSREFATMLNTYALRGEHIMFVVGDAAGLPEALRNLPCDIVALSEMTFPHEIARMMLIEQIYRAQTILDGHPYHK